MRIVNCARGGLVDEQALADLIGAAMSPAPRSTCSRSSRPRTSPLFGLEEVVVTPHLGASTGEAQENVALQVAEQISDYLTTGAVVNALNMPSVTAEEAPRLRPYMKLAEQLGSFAGQLTATGLTGGAPSPMPAMPPSLNTRPLTQVVLTGLLRPLLASVNMVNAPALAKQRNIDVKVVTTRRRGLPDPAHRRGRDRAGRRARSPARCSRTPSRGWSRSAASRSRHGSAAHMLYVRNQDQPGLHRCAGPALGDAQINIATFHLGRDRPGGDAIALVEVDAPIPDALLDQVCRLPHVLHAKQLSF